MSDPVELAERRLLGAVLLDPSCIDSACESVSAEDFRDQRSRLVFAAMSELRDSGERIDAVSIAETLRSQGNLELGGGIAYVTSLDEAVTAVGASAYAEMVIGFSRLRQIETAAIGLTASAHQAKHTDAEAIVSTAVDNLLSISGPESVKPIALGDSVSLAVEETRQRHQSGGEMVGVTTGFRPLDKILCGLVPGGVYVLGGATGRGKTTLALNMALAAAQAGHRVLYVSLEMKHTYLSKRLLSMASMVDASAIRSGRLTDNEVTSVIAASKKLDGIGENFHVVDKPGLHISFLRRIVRSMKARGAGPELVVVDYLQLLDSEESYSRERQVAKLSNSLLQMADESDTAVLALSQLNADGRIRESRAVENDAAAILRIDYEDELEPGDEAPDVVLSVLKHRHGDDGSVKMTFLRKLQRFALRHDEMKGYHGFSGETHGDDSY